MGPEAPASRRRRATAALAALLLQAVAAAAGARALTIQASAANCSGISEAFTALNQAYEAATKSSPITLRLTMDCAGSFKCEARVPLVVFNPAAANTTNSRQPAVTISIDAGPKCRKGDSRPIIDISDIDDEGSTLFNINELFYPKTRVDLRVSNLRFTGKQIDLFTNFAVYGNTSSKLTFKNIATSMIRSNIQFASTVAVDGSLFEGAFYAPLQLFGNTDRLTVKGTKFLNSGVNGYPGAIWARNLGPKVKVSVERSVFNATGGLDMAQVLYAGFDSEVSMSMKNNVFLNSTGSVNATVCVNNINNGTRSPRVNVAGNTGLDPSRRSSNQQAPWPTSSGCNVAFFTQV